MATREQIDGLKAELEEARTLLEKEDWLEARDEFLRLLGRAHRLGIDSADLHFCLSLGQLRLGNLEEAFRSISAAVAADPVHPSLYDLFIEITDAMRNRLVLPNRQADDHQSARLYEILHRSGDTDASCHLAMTRSYLRLGDLDAAWKLVEATTLLEPAHAEAWKLRAEVARRRGDEGEAAESDARASALASQSAPYGMPSPLTAC